MGILELLHLLPHRPSLVVENAQPRCELRSCLTKSDLQLTYVDKELIENSIFIATIVTILCLTVLGVQGSKSASDVVDLLQQGLVVLINPAKSAKSSSHLGLQLVQLGREDGNWDD